jgi:hypothetical protein
MLRKAACKILEGAKEAFQRRAKIYGWIYGFKVLLQA